MARDLATRRKHDDVRGLLGAYLAERMLLGEGRDGWLRLREALRRGDLSRTRTRGIGPSGEAYLRALRKFLVQTGYVSAVEAARLLASSRCVIPAPAAARGLPASRASAGA